MRLCAGEQRDFRSITICIFLETLVILFKTFGILLMMQYFVMLQLSAQVEITGPDAAQFVQLLTPRNLSECAVGQCKYVLITDENGGVLNDPVLLRLAENHFWLSLADSDILMWAKGVAVNSGLNVNLSEPDVSPLQLQGPRSWAILLKQYLVRE